MARRKDPWRLIVEAEPSELDPEHASIILAPRSDAIQALASEAEAIAVCEWATGIASRVGLAVANDLMAEARTHRCRRGLLHGCGFHARFGWPLEASSDGSLSITVPAEQLKPWTVKVKQALAQVLEAEAEQQRVTDPGSLDLRADHQTIREDTRDRTT